MRNEAFGLTFLVSWAAAAGAAHAGEAVAEVFERYEPGAIIELSEGRTVKLRVNDGHVEVAEARRVDRLSSPDFAETHVLVADLSGDGVKELLIEMLPSRSGSCYELWSATSTGYVRGDELFCNPMIGPGGGLVTSERDGPYSRIREYEVDHDGTLQWVRRQQPLSPDFSRIERRMVDGSVSSSVIYLGLPECGEARITVDDPVPVSELPGTAPMQELAGELRVLDVRALGPRDEWVLVRGHSAEGWLPSTTLGDLKAASRRQCAAARNGPEEG